MKRINEQVLEGERLLKNCDFDDFGRLLNESWMLKKSLSKVISNNKINELYSFAMQNGALGGKLLGAGGGGFMLFYMPKNLQKKFLEKINKKTVRVPFKFSNEGSTITFNKD